MSRLQRAPVAPQEQFVDLSFPKAGISKLGPVSSQPPVEMRNKEWGRTCIDGINVRAWEGTTQRVRGGSRPGIAKYIPATPIAGWMLQDLNYVVGTSPMQLSQSGRQIYLVTVSQGRVFWTLPGGTSWTEATNVSSTTPALNFAGLIYSTALNQELWFVDGTNYRGFIPSVNEIANWGAAKGVLPRDSNGNGCRLITTWRGRITLSGLLGDPQNVFFSAVGDETDFDYAPLNTTPTQAIALNSPLFFGQIGEPVTTLIPFTDDVLIIGQSGQIHILNGDPADGGKIDLLSRTIGMAWGRPWAMGPEGEVYFFSNRCGIYVMTFGQSFFKPIPQRISQQIEQDLQKIDTGNNTITMYWDDRFQCLHVFVSPTAAPGTTTHFTWERRTGGWFKTQFGNMNFDPLCGCIFDGNTVGDRAVLISSWDGYVRTVSTNTIDATDDDGTAISSSVVIGPVTSKNLDEFLLKDLQAVLGQGSGSVNYDVYTGATAELALAGSPVVSGTWGQNRNLTSLIRRAGHALYVKLSSTTPWSLETIRARIAGQGKVRRRGA